MVPSMRERTALGLLLALDLAGLRLMHDLHAAPWASLSATSSPADTVAAVLRLAAIGLGWWLVASTLLYVGARVVAERRRARSALLAVASRFTLPLARRVVDGAVVAALSVGPVLPAAAAETAIPPVVLIERPDHADRGHQPNRLDAPQPPTLPSPQVAPPATPLLPIPRPRPTATPVRPTATDARAEVHQHVVRPGEHLWSIAAGVIGDGSPQDVAEYWRRLVEANRHRLRSGHPDLIHPGERLVLPPR